ncbi:hypothetical protein AJ80_00499 [Polytolypa hystricis UAMH7299]|uniref:Uncharacterized protein n=1 Tax=Polytolypa hystricis (strain UAMH7299) TaxID=1447883 RepID=A0A2B7Z3S5_POLH7|nr:hypothetical protein AJ80_00499 [Polytolypa hystricis UAMH7299]
MSPKLVEDADVYTRYELWLCQDPTSPGSCQWFVAPESFFERPRGLLLCNYIQPKAQGSGWILEGELDGGL